MFHILWVTKASFKHPEKPNLKLENKKSKYKKN